MNKKKFGEDTYVGAAMIALSAIIILLSHNMPAAPKRFPLIVAAVLVFCGALVIVRSVKKTQSAEETENGAFQWKECKYSLGLLALIIVYALLMEWITFFPATMIIIPVFMLFLRVRKWWVIVLTDVLTTAFVYWLFVVQLSIRLP